MTKAELIQAIREDKARGANLCRADLRRANLSEADLSGANLSEANLRRANLEGADLEGADLSGADLRGADLRGTILDFASFPLWCGSFDIIADDRLAWQLIAHLTRLDTSQCSGDVQEAIRAMTPYADRFCEYQEDMKPLAD